MSQQLHFKISSALKNIIGRDLIKDDFIAVFELVKNSYDAHASKVDIYFENIYSENAKIIIKDNGKGMSYDDLINKWLFVAYSAKKEGTEEDSFDYRNRIIIKRAYAGAKGIGRFSCDRLGSLLYLETKKDASDSKVESLLTDWNKFEGDLKDEFIDVSVLHETLTNGSIDYEHGTVLEISNLHSTWDRQKLLRLKDALAKLINPNSQREDDGFKIILHVSEEFEEDNKQKQYRKRVNGEIQNLIFETLDWKTTKIVSDVYHDKIVTSLFEGGKLIYTLNENNSFHDLNDIHYTIYFLNRSAKVNFSKKMGIRSVDYGHIFMYKNGLRIYPYGERGEDPLKMDNRKAQGHSRYLGTREVIGFIDIKGDNEELRETSSRGDGLVITKAYSELKAWFLVTLRRLERYGIDIIDWGNDLSPDDYINLSNEDRVDALLVLIERLTKAKDIISYELSPEILDILNQKQQSSAPAILKSLKEDIYSEDLDKSAIVEKIAQVEKDISQLKKIKDEAEDEALNVNIKNEELAQKLDSEKKQGIFQRSIIGMEKEQIIGLQHQIRHSSSRIKQNIQNLIENVDFDKLGEKTKKYLTIISLEASKIESIANFVTKANFKLTGSEIEEDLISFFSDYIQEIYLAEKPLIKSGLRKIIVEDNYLKLFKLSFRPLEITTLIDNFINNSEKAGASEIRFKFQNQDGKLGIEINDNGKGIPVEYLGEVFNFGFTTTDGSGIGLAHIKNIVSNLKGTINVSSVVGEGSTFEIFFNS